MLPCSSFFAKRNSCIHTYMNNVLYFCKIQIRTYMQCCEREIFAIWLFVSYPLFPFHFNNFINYSKDTFQSNICYISKGNNASATPGLGYIDAGPHIEYQAIKILCFTIVYWLSLGFNGRFPDIFVTMVKLLFAILVGK